MLDYSKRKCYGFVKNKSEEFIINEAEASNVKLIFECFLSGMSLSEIVNELSFQGIPSPSGKETWSRKVISSTLSNEKYHLYGIISITDYEMAQLDKSKRSSVVVDLNETVVEITEVISEKILFATTFKKTIVKRTEVCYYIIVKFYSNVISSMNLYFRIKCKLLQKLLIQYYLSDS